MSQSYSHPKVGRFLRHGVKKAQKALKDCCLSIFQPCGRQVLPSLPIPMGAHANNLHLGAVEVVTALK